MNENSLHETGAQISLARCNKELSIATLSKRAGISKEKLEEAEQGKSALDLADLMCIAEVLSIPTSRLLEKDPGTFSLRGTGDTNGFEKCLANFELDVENFLSFEELGA